MTRRVASSSGRAQAFGWAMAFAALLAALAGGLWLMLRIAPPVPWRLDLGRLAHNLVPRTPEDLSHRRASWAGPAAARRNETTPQSGQTP